MFSLWIFNYFVYFQKINHFPGMSEICRKDLLARNLNRMNKMFPKEYNIFPKTWCLPAEWVLADRLLFILLFIVLFIVQWMNLVHGTCFYFSNLCFCSYGDFLAYTRQKKNKTYILKPETGCQGRGIWVTRNPKEIKPHEHMICQQYMARVSVCRLDVLLILCHTS